MICLQYRIKPVSKKKKQKEKQEMKWLKKSRFIALLIVLLFVSGLFAQDVMRITRKDRTFIDIPTGDIESITFLAGAPQTPTDQPRDGDGNVYKTVRIGNQVWMAENLRTTKFIDGTPIPEIRDKDAWEKATGPAFCWPNNDKATYFKPFGAVYNWEVASSDKIAPAGWRVATLEDFEELISYLKTEGKSGFGALSKLQGIWDLNKGTDELGLGLLPSGSRGAPGKFGGRLWSSSINYQGPTSAYSLDYGVSHQRREVLSIRTDRRSDGYPIRFIKE